MVRQKKDRGDSVSEPHEGPNAPDSLTKAAFWTLWGLPRRIRLFILFVVVVFAGLFALWTSLPDSSKKSLLSKFGLEGTTKKEGELLISQVLYGNDDSGRFMSIILNNLTKRKYIVQKIVYSRGRSSAMEIANMTCCPYCGGPAIYFVDEFESTSGATVSDLQISFRENSARAEVYSGRVAFSHGCYYPTFAQLELPVAITILEKETFNIKVYIKHRDKSQESKQKNDNDSAFTIKDIIAGPDTVCVYIYTDGTNRLQHCAPEEELVKGGLFL